MFMPHVFDVGSLEVFPTPGMEAQPGGSVRIVERRAAGR
jgi:hypothetical protein